MISVLNSQLLWRGLYTCYSPRPSLAECQTRSVLETLQVVSCIHMMYTYLLIDFANVDKILRVVW